MLYNLVDTNNNFFKGLSMKRFIVEKELKSFTYYYKKACNLGKTYVSPKIRKRFSDVQGRSVFQIMEWLLKRYRNVWIITLNQFYKMANRTLEILGSKSVKKIPTKNLIKMAEFEEQLV